MARSAHWPRIGIWAFGLWLVLVGVLLGTLLGPKLRETLPEDRLKALRLVHRAIVEKHVVEHDPHELLDDAIDGMVAGIDDDWSLYVRPRELDDFVERTTGRYAGIGVILRGNTVLFPLRGGGAERAGILPGDRIVAVEGEGLGELPDEQLQEEIVTRVKGGDEGPVQITVRRGESELTLSVERGPVQKPSVKWVRLLPGERRLGYLYLSDFQSNTREEFDRSLADLEDEAGGSLDGLILDLRFDGGGFMEECLALARRFLPSGVIATIEGRGGEVQQVHQADPDQCTHPGLPLVLLVNGRTASASEVLAGALHDHDRAGLVGTRTYGKGMVQSIFRWEGLDFRLKLTTAHYVTPSGRVLRRTTHEGPPSGIEPDVEVPVDEETRNHIAYRLQRYEPPREHRSQAAEVAADLGQEIGRPLDPGEDPQLAAGLEALRERIGGHTPGNGR